MKKIDVLAIGTALTVLGFSSVCPAAEKQPSHLKGLTQLSPVRVDLDARMSMLCRPAPPPDPRPTPHRRSAILVYTNEAALAYRRDHPDGHDYPIGAVFLKEKYANQKVEQPHLATVMKRLTRKGDISDWEFSVISLPDGKPETLSKKNAAACADCHGDFGKQGFISRHTESLIYRFLQTPSPPKANAQAATPRIAWNDFATIIETRDTLQEGDLVRTFPPGVIRWDDSKVDSQTLKLVDLPIRVVRHHADSKGFLALSAEAEKLREKRLLTEEGFARLAKQGGVVVLDPRSRRAFEKRHVAGAVNLPYTDFTPDSLAEVIPAKDTRVLIYCSNHLDYPQPSLEGGTIRIGGGSEGEGGTIEVGGGFKGATAALTIPTFITLYGYGYKNLYELGPTVKPDESPIEFVSKTK